MHGLWQTLLANVAIISLFISLTNHVQTWLERRSVHLRSAAFGLLMGGGALALMAFPFEVHDGILADLRNTMIAISAFFGGPVAGIITALVAIVYRLSEGGAGALAGVLAISLTLGVAVAARLSLRGRQPSRSDIVIMAGAIAAGTALSLLALPHALWQTLIPLLAPPLVSLVFVSALVAGIAIDQEVRQRRTMRENRIYRAVIEALPDCLNAKDTDGRFIIANPATARLMRAENAAALIGLGDAEFYPLDVAEKFRADEVKILADGVACTTEQKVVHHDGSEGWLTTLKVPLRDENGTITGIITHNRDITDRKQLEDELAESRLQLSEAIAQMADALVMFDRDGRLVLCNETYRKLFPMTADIRVPGVHIRDILRASIMRGEQAGSLADDLADPTDNRHTVEGTRQFELTDGRWLEARTRTMRGGGWLAVISDISESKRGELTLIESNAKLATMAKFDGLTGLVNRREFDAVLEQELARSARAKSATSLLMIDIDHFKAFNDTYGHPAGDACLKIISNCLKSTLMRPADIAARYGGEEFSAILPDTSAEGAFHIAEAFREAVHDLGLVHSGSDIGVVTVSIGVATSTDASQPRSSVDLIQLADKALYGAKHAGRDRVHGWRPHASKRRA